MFNCVLLQAPNIPKPDENKQPDNAAGTLAEEAKYFVECLLLNRDVDVVLESTNNNNLVGSILHEVITNFNYHSAPK